MLTQAGGLLPLDLCQLGDGVGSIALREDYCNLLADYLILTMHTHAHAHTQRHIQGDTHRHGHNKKTSENVQ